MHMSVAFGSWCAYMSQCLLMRRVVRKLTDRLMRHVFAGWLEAVDMRRLERAEEEHEASLALLRSEIEAQRATLRSRAVAQIEARCFAARKSQCFTQWHWWVRRAVSQQRAVSQMLA